MVKRLFPFFIAFLCQTHPLLCQQIPDLAYDPEIKSPAYQDRNGPAVCIDEGHYNFHTKDRRYAPFAQLLERDGYRTIGFKSSFDSSNLNSCKILVISNALNEQNEEAWVRPVHSAFTADEIAEVEVWVSNGGSLFLIADHMPLAGAAADLGAAFGFQFTDGFVFHGSRGQMAIFNKENGGLLSNKITNGREETEKITEVVTFTGQAFKIPKNSEGVLIFDNSYTNYLPDSTAWVFHDKTQRKSVDGWYQAAFMPHGKGRIFVSGEAAMFSAQLSGSEQNAMGMNNPLANQNYKFLLNIIHWLDGLY